MRKGCVHIYTGNGKGKTTAAVGLAARALGAGFNVSFLQFLKSKAGSELATLKKSGGRISVFHCGKNSFIKGEPLPSDRLEAERGLATAKKAISSGRYDLVILDEVLVAVSLGLIREDGLLDLLRKRSPHVEVVLTGRGATRKLLKFADLVTEMKEVKHYFSKGLRARKGIEF